MSDNPLVSIVTPSLNVAPHLEQAIRNVVAQGYDRFEHIVVDGASTDATPEVLARYGHLRWRSEPDRGQADALNKGFRMARGEIIGWLNADDYYASDAIHAACVAFEADPDLDIVFGDCEIVDGDDQPIRIFRPGDSHWPASLLGRSIHTPAVFLRRSVIEKNALLREDLHYCMDNEFWLRLAPVTKARYLPRVLASYRLRPGNKLTTDPAAFAIEMCTICVDAFQREPWRTELPEELKRNTLGVYHWQAGVLLTRAGRREEALPYLRSALDEYDILASWEQTIAPFIMHFETQVPYPEAEALSLVDIMPVAEHERVALLDLLRSRGPLLRFYVAKQAGESDGLLKQGVKALLADRMLIRNRGFLRTLLGRQSLAGLLHSAIE